ncbi:MAG: peptidase M64 [Bacteroidetes bacterium HGW-Bacteroidetes-1]|jgi:hypothetical protein|nr:MAG: peptidase M64 [Bacteroidetes bacterium HGW-Bacteroidetes-1]
MVKLLLSTLLLFLFHPIFAQFDNFFLNKSLRMDYIHSGTASQEFFALDYLMEESYWGGSKINLVDTFNYGNHRIELCDSESGLLLYSRGYSSLFAEWQTTSEAKLVTRSFYETVVMPFPQKPVKATLSSRNREGRFEQLFSIEINPDDYFIRPVRKRKYEIYEVMINSNPEHAVDIVILPDGYTDFEMDKFKQDCDQFKEELFRFEPYSSYLDKFNIRAVLAPSLESGIAIPAKDIWPETILSSSFYTFDSERYCMTYDHKAMRDLAGMAPYDQIYVLANTKKYGGGGIFNFYCLSSSSNRLSGEIFVHEFGHGFAGLGDEYYDSSTAYDDFYNLEIEPWEPNLTTLVNFDAKWKNLLAENTPIPTPDTSQWNNTTGVFEGGGYVSRGMYRPSRDCLMHTFKGNTFCAACEKAIVKMIRFYSE